MQLKGNRAEILKKKLTSEPKFLTIMLHNSSISMLDAAWAKKNQP